MDLWHVKCGKCGYEKKLNLGSYDLGQTFTDLNEDFAYYKLFICRKENAFVTVNVHNTHFDNKCPADGSELMPVVNIPPNKCPRCNADIYAEKIDLGEEFG
ncbi:MAG: hypothetical protein QXU32_03205 [Nitrososphaerales archaeon]